MTEAPVVETAETVNIDQPHETMPHAKTVIAVTFFVLVCFALVSIYVLFKIEDATIRGAIIGTWTTMATSAGGFWLGSSSAGKLGKR